MSTQTAKGVDVDLQRFTDLRVLATLVAIAILGDIATTSYGLSMGIPEGNPFVRGLINSYGLLGMLSLKAIGVLWCITSWKLLGEKYGKAALLGLLIPQAIAVVLNVVTIVTA